jgi:hypothetical protein
MRRGLGYAVLVVVVAALSWPVVRDHDSFPLSTYPMFSDPLPRELWLTAAVGVEADGSVRRLSPAAIAGGQEPIHAVAVLDHAIEAGTADELCTEIVDRLQQTDGLVAVEIVTERHDVVGWFEGNTEPMARNVFARCPVTL